MALILKGKSTCGVCSRPLEDPIVGFPAFLPADHACASFSDAAFHQECFEADRRANEVRALYARYRAIWESRPELESLEAIEAWEHDALTASRPSYASG